MTEPFAVLHIPRPAEWISSNQRIHWRVKAGRNTDWKQAAWIMACNYRLRGLPPCRVVAELLMNPRRRSHIDPANYQDTAKACVDGLVKAGVWPDDSSAWVHGPDMRLHRLSATGPEYLVLSLHAIDLEIPNAK